MKGWRKRQAKILIRTTDYEAYQKQLATYQQIGYAIQTETQEAVLIKRHREHLRKTFDERTKQRNLNHRKRTHAEGIEYIAILVDVTRPAVSQ